MKALIASLFLLSACTNQLDKERSVQTTVNPHAEADWLFDKKMRCSSLRESLSKELKGSPAGIVEVFYSPVRNTCIYTTTTLLPRADIFFAINDALTGESYFSGSSYQNAEMSKAFDALVLELKGLKPNDPLGIR